MSADRPVQAGDLLEGHDRPIGALLGEAGRSSPSRETLWAPEQ
ncbi:hypothetical protein [Actinoplanes sp. GCM10030250]